MDPSLEEASEVAGASAFATLFTVTFPLIAPAILAGSLLSFVVMLGIYGVPAALGAPANINVLTTYIFKLTAWSPPLYNTAAAVAILLMAVTAILVWAQQRVLSARASPPWPARRSARAASISAPGAGSPSAWPSPTCSSWSCCRPWRWSSPPSASSCSSRISTRCSTGTSTASVHFNSVLDNPLTMLSIWNTMKVGVMTALVGGALAFAIGYTVNRTQRRRPPLDRPSCHAARRHPRPGRGRRLSLGLDRPAGRPLRHALDPGAGLRRALHARHGEGAVDLVPADPQGARGSRLDLRPRHARHHPHHRAAARPARRGGVDDAPVRAGDPRARLLALPLHQRHHRHGRAAARLLRGRQHRQDRRLQPDPDGDPRRPARHHHLAFARRREGSARVG